MEIELKLVTPDEPSCSIDRNERRRKILENYISKGSVGAEIGVFKGSFTATLLTFSPEKIYAVDPWYRFSKEWTWCSGNPSTIDALVNIISVFREEIEHGKVEPRVSFSSEFYNSMPENSLDWVYIDSIHTYDHMLEEIKGAIKLVKPGGYILGDDCHVDPGRHFHGVYLAVNKYVQEGYLEVCEEFPQDQFVTRLKL